MRKLAVLAFSFSAAIFAANYIFPPGWLPIFAIALALCAALTASAHRRWLRAAVLALVGAALGFGCFYIHDLRTREPVQNCAGETMELSGRILEYPQVYDAYCRVRFRVTEGEMKGLDGLLYDNGMWIAGAEPGQSLHFQGRIRPADVKFGEKYTGYNARDIYLIASAKGPVRVFARDLDWRTIPARLQHRFSVQIASLFPGDLVPFMKSLMLGDKTEFYREPGLQQSMSRAGLMHIVAVSGMHVSFLLGFLQLLLGTNRHSSLLGMVLIWLFVLVTGASPSAVRAGVMQSMLLLAPIVRRENDPPTSLATALALILLANPNAAASISLQLSFASMAGILCLNERISMALRALLPGRRLGRVMRPVNAAAASSVSAMIFTVPLVAMHFGAVSILSPLSNILCFWAISACFCGAYLSCGLAVLYYPLGAAAAWLTAWFARYILLIARLIAAVPFAAVYTRSKLMILWVLLCYCFFAVAALSKRDLRLRILVPLAMSALIFILFTQWTGAAYRKTPGVVTVLDVGQGQCVTAFSGSNTVMIDCGGLMTAENAGETAGSYLRSCGRQQVDLLLLTHLHEDHANGVPTLLEMLKVKTIILPQQTEDSGLYRQIRAAAGKQGTEILYLRGDMQQKVGKIGVSLYAPKSLEGDDNERCLLAKLSLGSYDLLVTGDASAEVERKLMEEEDLKDIELLVVGHHGSRYAGSEELLRGIGADTAVISVGYNNYGHPSEEVLERLHACGYNIYRTDKNGDVTVWIGQEYGEEER